MAVNHYRQRFEKVAAQIDKSLFSSNDLIVAPGIFQRSAFLKVFKPHWSTPGQDPLTAESRVFFSVWVEGLRPQKLFYNIHALKLRKLQGYSIESRKFAAFFRERFIPHSRSWPNVSTGFGPLTLMQGWVDYDDHTFTSDVSTLALRFTEIAHFVDDTLLLFKR